MNEKKMSISLKKSNEIDTSHSCIFFCLPNSWLSEITFMCRTDEVNTNLRLYDMHRNVFDVYSVLDTEIRSDVESNGVAVVSINQNKVPALLPIERNLRLLIAML